MISPARALHGPPIRGWLLHINSGRMVNGGSVKRKTGHRFAGKNTLNQKDRGEAARSPAIALARPLERQA
jgi:hypothetical protein